MPLGGGGSGLFLGLEHKVVVLLVDVFERSLKLCVMCIRFVLVLAIALPESREEIVSFSVFIVLLMLVK
jgi:hypothetical protein